MRLILPLLSLLALAADFPAVDPNVFPKDDPRAKDLPHMLSADVHRRMQEASLRESKAFAVLGSRAEWEAFRDARIKALKESLGQFPEAPKEMRIKVTRELAGDGYRIRNLVYETRPGLWATANLYLPASPSARMPGIIIAHSHHTPNTQGELQDMGMTWARAGTAVLVPEHIGHGERREHDFNTEKDFDQPYRVSRQDYYFRYNTALQLMAVGESLMGWMVWDLMRGVDVLLEQPGIDPARIILLGAVAGGGDVAGVTAALDPRIACVAPFNFSGWQPESSANTDPDRNFPWFGEGYWETTRGLVRGASDGFAHYIIVGSVAPRKVIYAHEFAWDPAIDPAWARMQKIFGFYGAKDSLRVTFGKGSVKGQAGPDNTHCTHIGAVHRKMISPALKEWFGMPIPEEYSKRRPAEDLKCWTEAARAELKPQKLHEVLMHRYSYSFGLYVRDRIRLGKEKSRKNEPGAAQEPDWFEDWSSKELAKRLGNIEPFDKPTLIEGKAEKVPGGRLARFALTVEPGIVVPFLLITPAEANSATPVVVMVGQGGKSEFLKQRGEAIAAFLKEGLTVCLVDVRGTGETRAGGGSADRSSARTSLSQTSLILGQSILAAQFRDLRTVLQWLRDRAGVDSKRIAVWGDTFAKTNATNAKLAVPLDANSFPAICEPLGALLAELSARYEKGLAAMVSRGRVPVLTLFRSPYVYMPHDALPPGIYMADVYAPSGENIRREGSLTAQNQVFDKAAPPFLDTADWVISRLRNK